MSTLKVWGCRGSYPMVGKSSAYGVNTSCISLETEDKVILFDAGTGIWGFRAAYAQAAEKHSRADRDIHIFLSHSHLDHISGLPTFFPWPGACGRIHVYGESRYGMDIREQLDRLVGPPFWPVSFSDSGKEYLVFHDIAPGSVTETDGMKISARRSIHPNSAVWYRLDLEPSLTVVHGLDCELSEAVIPGFAEFSRGADLMILDAHFSPEDMAARRGWGHASYEECIRTAALADAGTVLLAHLNPQYGDPELAELERRASAFAAETGKVKAVFAREGLEMVL